ncbi:hypothetical protein HXX76_004278 [Chlamydomonas incerta]|uniref:Uncharacterized protein n=1 Tax=Chlamydomonas incerta TaxID=51695 RepID=A0A835TM01_CHLIN|nr:hypothetical protein HXX76_004278 [Chlamydomonas incerta]|eukprot:KAG2440165.1 hypothetical protein HXX76_004278 [Chlamydomonas incerta]
MPRLRSGAATPAPAAVRVTPSEDATAAGAAPTAPVSLPTTAPTPGPGGGAGPEVEVEAEAAVRAVWHCAVSLAFLQRFARDTVRQGWTTYDILQRVVLPATSDRRCRYVDMLPPADSSTLTYFVSYAWSMPFTLLVDLLSHHLHSADPKQVRREAAAARRMGQWRPRAAAGTCAPASRPTLAPGKCGQC